jgi:hypothetical protein
MPLSWLGFFTLLSFDLEGCKPDSCIGIEELYTRFEWKSVSNPKPSIEAHTYNSRYPEVAEVWILPSKAAILPVKKRPYLQDN